jgi:hypothetical protein
MHHYFTVRTNYPDKLARIGYQFLNYVYPNPPCQLKTGVPWKKPTTFGRALKVLSVTRIEATISEVKGACSAPSKPLIQCYYRENLQLQALF